MSGAKWVGGTLAAVALVFLISWFVPSGPVRLNSETDRNLYYLGTKFGTGAMGLKLTEAEARLVTRGFEDAILNRVPRAVGTEETRPAKLQEYLGARRGMAQQDNARVGETFFKQFVAGGARTTPSGLAYKIEASGEGDKPGPADVVEIKYTGRLVDGTVFASSDESKEPTRYPLGKIIAGWAEGIQLLRPGGKISLVIPPKLGYGDNGSPPKVPAGATLLMDVRLEKVIKLAARKGESGAAQKE